MSKEGYPVTIHEKEHIIDVLKKVKQALEKKNYVEVKNLSNHIIHHASIHQEPDIISLAVILYALSKLIEREAYKKYKSWPEFYNNYVKHLNNSIKTLEIDNLEAFRNEMNLIRQSIQNLSGDLKTFLSEVFRKAEINKASRLYEHGISMEKTAKILGITQWELAEYVGRTGIGNVNLGITLPIKERIKYIEEIFEK